MSEPILLKAGDRTVLVNGQTLPVDFRIVAEDKYQSIMAELQQLSEAQRELKARIAELENPWISVNDRLPEEFIARDYQDKIALLESKLKEQAAMIEELQVRIQSRVVIDAADKLFSAGSITSIEKEAIYKYENSLLQK